MTNAERFHEALNWIKLELQGAEGNPTYTKEILITNLRDRVDAALGEGAYAPREEEEKTCAFKATNKSGKDILLCIDCVKDNDLDGMPLNREELASHFVPEGYTGKAACSNCCRWIYLAEDV